MPLNPPLNRDPHVFWWFYLALVLGLTVLSLLSGPSSPLDVVLTILSSFSLVGLWGYVRQLAIGWREFWAGYFFIYLLLCTAGLVFVAADVRPWSSALFVVAFAIVLSVPLWLALWRYAFCSQHIWSPTAA